MDKAAETFSEWFQSQTFERAIAIAIGVVIILVINHFIGKALTERIKDNSRKYRARKAVNMIAYILVVCVVLFVYSDKLGNIGVALGVAGAGVAFALQEVIVSLAGWLNIMIVGTVSVGQRVKIADVTGDIIDIGILSTTIMETGDWVRGDLYNGRIVTLSNSFIFKEKVHNYSAEYPFLWDEIQVPMRTESDYKQAKEVFIKVLEEICGDYADQSRQEWASMANRYRIEDAQVQPMVTLEINENWILFTLRYIVDFKKRRSTKDEIFNRILEELNSPSARYKLATSTLEVTTIQGSGIENE
ncbi:mechanosensitive ion channel family protein [bacterium]|nr:mechanosensitive ion channel family protein [bacterium]